MTRTIKDGLREMAQKENKKTFDKLMSRLATESDKLEKEQSKILSGVIADQLKNNIF